MSGMFWYLVCLVCVVCVYSGRSGMFGMVGLFSMFIVFLWLIGCRVLSIVGMVCMRGVWGCL